MPRKKSKRKENAEIVKALSMLSQLGVSAMISVGLSLFIGYQLDELLNTGYVFILVFLFIGIAAAIKSAYTLTKGFYSKNLKEENEKRKYYDDLYKQRKESYDNKKDLES